MQPDRWRARVASVGTAVRCLARWSDESRLRRVATVVDSSLGVLPARIGEKLVALTVESAAIAGYDRADARRPLV